ncbi:fused MFS/spermidine synthase [soil metagenome]
MPTSRSLYAATIFLSSLLLFLIEPIAAKRLLPLLGGSSAVWMTCLVFFQVTLLLGYLYAHSLTRNRSANAPARLHLGVIAVAVVLALTLLTPGVSADPSHPVRAIFLTLTTSIGLPFLLLASTSPLLQVWLARTTDGPVPYRLFALSNVGSLLALFLYPTVLEPNLTLRHQRILWLAGFLLYAALLTLLTLGARSIESIPASEESVRPTLRARSTSRQRLLWFLLPMAAAMQLTAVTGHLSANIAAIPLLWMLPLAVYLLSFIVAFEYPALYKRATITRLLVILLTSLGYALSKTDTSLPIAVGIGFFLAECFLACLFCHAEAHALRPEDPSDSTLFYLLIAAGGATGTFFIGIASPLIFSANYDLPIAFCITAAVAVPTLWREGLIQRILWSTAAAGLLLLAVMLHVAYERDALLLTRNFYGTLRIKQTNHAPYSNGQASQQAAPTRMMLNGTIQHGNQIFSPALVHTPTTYYGANSGIGLALTLCCQGRPRNVGVIGLGAGTLAAYGERGDRFRFYELNPAVEPIARNLFTYLRDSKAQTTVLEGDARTTLASEPPQKFNVLVIDAFSGDAIPLHLLTAQALTLYRSHLAPGGILAFHVSNQYVDLAPEVALLAANAHLKSASIDSPANNAEGAYRASWVLVTDNEAFLANPLITENQIPVPRVLGIRLWTDDYSSLLPLLKF